MIKHSVNLQMPADPKGIAQAKALCWPALGRTHVGQEVAVQERRSSSSSEVPRPLQLLLPLIRSLLL